MYLKYKYTKVKVQKISSKFRRIILFLTYLRLLHTYNWLTVVYLVHDIIVCILEICKTELVNMVVLRKLVFIVIHLWYINTMVIHTYT